MNVTQIVGPAANIGGIAKPKTLFEIPLRAAKRAATNYTVDDNGCFISNYSVASHGYAQIGWQDGSERRVTTAHRAAWVYAHGTQIPEGMTIDHICKTRRCVNPNHLRLMTNFENARRTAGRDWPVGECINGHSNEHLVKGRGGRYECKLCRKIWDERYTARIKIAREKAAVAERFRKAREARS